MTVYLVKIKDYYLIKEPIEKGGVLIDYTRDSMKATKYHYKEMALQVADMYGGEVVAVALHSNEGE